MCNMLTRPLAALLLLMLVQSGWAARLEVVSKPENKELNANVAALIGDLDGHDAASLRRYQRAAVQQARLAGEALGYYSNRYRSEVLDGEKPVLRVHVRVREPVRLRTVDIRVEGEAAGMDAFRVRDPRLKPGEQLHHGAYDEIKSALQQQGLRYGFFAGKFTRHRLLVDPAAGAADIELHYDSGPRYRLGAVEFAEAGKIDDRLLAALVPFEDGTPYDSALLAGLSQNLQNTGYFAGVQVDAQGTADGPQVIPVQVRLEPAKPRTLGLGAGFSTDVGPRGSFSWERHRVNSKGHKLGFDSEISKPKQNLSGWYAIPLSSPLSDELRFVAGYQREELVDASSERLTLGTQWRKKVRHDWQRTIGLRWEDERYEYDRGSNRSRHSKFLLPSIGFAKLKSDSALDPSKGYRLQMDVSAGSGNVLSDADVVHVSALARGLTTLADKHRVLARIEVGGVATDKYSAIPPSLRFFAGGDQSVRGYDYQSLSPRDAQRNRVGGRYLVAQSLEYQYEFVERWRAATFIDAGNATDSLTDSMKVGVGAGIRWVSPIGPLRLDFAHALHDDRGWRIHFSMGPEL
ncbi:autotransporter secretion outer membrane protein TamA [Thiopseudomonas denitrificans]|uniref:Translocation and assembly module subunit TamA n=2 Tax=Thiopseudomonas denitrificans TaxID=1501432 RepID=A0A4R6U1R7_9GAMM|nr:autotransporter secretion outer membrane protein TamA [Thiopseudomonas denitrificans]